MARDGSGTYTRVVTPPVNGDIADADDFNAEIDDIASALTGSINAAGTKPFGANQPMGGFKLTGLAAGASNGDSVRYEQLTGLSATYQPLDATLTALAALSWSSGNALLQFTAADTVSLTLAPSVNSVTANQATGASTATARFVNSVDSASVKVLTLEGDRATMATSDEAYVSMLLSDSAGNQDEFARLTWQGASLTSGAENGAIQFSVISAGSLSARALLGTGSFRPTTNDLLTLGSASFSWADLFLASGGVINWNNGTFTLTQAGTVVTASGTIAAGALVGPPLASSETGGTLTGAACRNRRVKCASNPTLPASGMTEGDWILFDPGGTARTVTRPAAHTMYIRDTDSATGTSYAQNAFLAIYNGSSKWTLHGMT